MTGKAFPWLSGFFVVALLAGALLIPGAHAQSAPTVNGQFWGDDDSNLYNLVDQTVPPTGDPGELCNNRSQLQLYQYQDEDTLYVAAVEDRCVCDNVFAGDSTADLAYVATADWDEAPSNAHTFQDLHDSDNICFQVTCSDPDTLYSWCQDLIYQEGCEDDSGNGTGCSAAGTWKSDYSGDDVEPEGVTNFVINPPPISEPTNFVSASSTQWNMNNGFDVTYGGARAYAAWKSPDDTGGAANNDVTDEPGYPADFNQPITDDPGSPWEWPIVYEWSIDTSWCMGDIEVEFVAAHNSPTKGGDDPPPLAVELLWFEVTKAERTEVTLGWETASETDNLGFNLYRATSVNGERITINGGLIPTNLPPGSPFGAEYEYTDTPMGRARTYYYWLEAVDIYGNTELYGPVEASLFKRLRLWELLRRLVPVKPPTE